MAALSWFFVLTPSTILAVPAPEDIDFGYNFDEQQGGGGLVGETIRILNGNVIEHRRDLRFPSPNSLGLTLDVFYNSRSTTPGAFGYGWSHTYEVSLDPGFAIEAESYLRIIAGDGRALYFNEEEPPGEYRGAFHERSHVTLDGEEYVWHRLDGAKYVFFGSGDNLGKLKRIEDEKGNLLQLEYDSSGRLETVIDNATGRSIIFNYDSVGRVESVSGPVTASVERGIWVSYGYDNGNLTSVTYWDGRGFNYTYADTGHTHNLTRKADKKNHVLNEWSYDGEDRAIYCTSINGKGVSIRYISETSVEVVDAYGTPRIYDLADVGGRKRVSSISGPSVIPYSESNTVRWVYDTDMRLVEVEYGGGSIDQYTDYDERGNPGTVKLAVEEGSALREIHYLYHPWMNVPLTRTEVSVLSTTGNKETIYDYDDDGNAIPNENPTGLISRIIEKGFTRDESGKMVSYEHITVFTYNGKGQLSSISGPRRDVDDITYFFYDSDSGDLLGIERPEIGFTHISGYDAAGKPWAVTDENGRSMSFFDSYMDRPGGEECQDGRHRGFINEVDGGTTTFLFDEAGELKCVTDPDGVTMIYEYDPGHGKLIRITDKEGNYKEYGYDEQGNPEEVSYHDPGGFMTYSMRYDYLHPETPGKLYRMINPDGTFTEYGYDGSGNVVSVNNVAITYEYDALNRLRNVTQSGDVTTSYQYDAHGNLVSVTDPEGRETTYEYDDMGRMLSVTSPDRGTVKYLYDESGNLVQKIDARGIVVQYDYDGLNRLTRINFPDPTRNITFTYDQGPNGKGRLTAMIDPSGESAFTYDARGRLVKKTGAFGGRAYTLRYNYTRGNRLKSITYPSGMTVKYHRNEAGEIERISSTHNALVTDISYLPFGPPKSMAVGNSVEITHSYDLLYRIRAANEGSDNERRYTYDANGNVTNILLPNNTSMNRNFVYDDLNRLVSAGVPRFTTGGIGRETYTYDYDLVGNRLSRQINNEVEEYSYYSGTNLLSGVTGIDPVSFSYDASGNAIAVGDRTLSYNQGARLEETHEGGGPQAHYTYDGKGRRVIKEYDGKTTLYYYDEPGRLIASYDVNEGTETDYIYLGDRVLAKVILPEGDYCEGDSDNDGDVDDLDLDGFASKYGGTDCDQGGPCDSDVDGDGDVDGVDLALIAQDSGRSDCPVEMVYYFDNDHLGTPLRITDANNEVVWEATYAPFGRAEINPALDPVFANNLRFPGQIFDPETGFHYNYHRFYHPGTGRYLRPDPIGLKGGVNLYAYALNNAVNMTDPSGQVVGVAAAIVIARVAIGAAAGAFGGWAAGKVQGNTVAAILGGVAGAAVGGGVGLFFPQASTVVGGTIGSAIAGAFGGTAGGMLGGMARIDEENPQALIEKRLLAGAKGAAKGFIIGIITGGITGGMGTAAVLVGAHILAADLAGIMTATPIGLGLDLLGFGSGADVTAPAAPVGLAVLRPVTADTLLFQYDQNDLTVKRNQCVTVSVVGGKAPYRWSVAPQTRFFLASTETYGLTNTICAKPNACGGALITVTDSNGGVAKLSVREPHHGKWKKCVDYNSFTAVNCTRSTCRDEVVGRYHIVVMGSWHSGKSPPVTKSCDGMSMKLTLAGCSRCGTYYNTRPCNFCPNQCPCTHIAYYKIRKWVCD